MEDNIGKYYKSKLKKMKKGLNDGVCPNAPYPCFCDGSCMNKKNANFKQRIKEEEQKFFNEYKKNTRIINLCAMYDITWDKAVELIKNVKEN